MESIDSISKESAGHSFGITVEAAYNVIGKAVMLVTTLLFWPPKFSPP